VSARTNSAGAATVDIPAPAGRAARRALHVGTVFGVAVHWAFRHDIVTALVGHDDEMWQIAVTIRSGRSTVSPTWRSSTCRPRVRRKPTRGRRIRDSSRSSERRFARTEVEEDILVVGRPAREPYSGQGIPPLYSTPGGSLPPTAKTFRMPA
jgi:hypothetical protein